MNLKNESSVLNETTNRTTTSGSLHNRSVLAHLENEMEEQFKVNKEETVSLAMVEITMDFNELQKRFNDMTNPDFWL